MSSDEESGTLLDVLSQDEENQVEQEMLDDSLKNEIKRVLTILPSRDADIIKTYFGLDGGVGLTLEEIGDQFGLTRERVRQIKERSLRRLRRATSSKSLKSYLS
jgi:RNA polymerase primary sigma factor